jgi:hypothetical protein
MGRFESEPIPIRDLETGVIESERNKHDFDSVGEAIFWACLDEVSTTHIARLREASLTVVKEPGKARSVTKGHAALKIVMDTISKICAVPMLKGVESSASGMGRSHHAWNFFNSMFNEELRKEVFSPLTEDYEDFVSHRLQTIVWEDCYVGSTDYETSTDSMHHDFCKIAGNAWMTKCGIPRFLKGIVNGVFFYPRSINFTALGPLVKYGDPYKGSSTERTIVLERGILMGDPLTKIILHLSNIVTRTIGDGLVSGTLFEPFHNGIEAFSVFRQGYEESIVQ